MIDGFGPMKVKVFLTVLIILQSLVIRPVIGHPPDTVMLPVRSLRIAIHVFQNDSGSGNFHQDSTGHEKFLYRLTDWVNHRMANLDTLKPEVPSPFIADSRVRIRLDTIFYHRDSHAWDCSAEIDSDYMRDRYVDSDSTQNYLQKYQTLPVFIGANNSLTGGHVSHIGDRGYIAVRGYYESFLRQSWFQATDECGRNLVHELCHCLGLSHNFTGGPGGEQCDDCDDNGCPVEGSSNNIMDYWPSYGYALSLCQFKKIHYFLNGRQGNISEVVIRDSCYCLRGAGYLVPAGDTLWIRDTVYLHNNLVLGYGGVLVVQGYLSMPGDAGITVQAGGILKIDGGTIGNLCGDLWAGIRVPENREGVPARVSISGGGAVEHARIGLLAAGPVATVFDHSVFRNCVESIAIRGSADSIRVVNCTFRITSKLNHYEEGITPGFFIRTEGIPKLVVSESVFINEPGTGIFDSEWMGTGIYSDAHSIRISHCEFTNLTSGLVLNSRNNDSKAEVVNNQFTHNRCGIRSCFDGIQWFSGNHLILQRFNTGNTLGMLLTYPGRFALNGNVFESVYGGENMAGLVIRHPTHENSPVFSNRFSNLPVAVFMDGMPDIDPALFTWAEGFLKTDSLKLGPQFRYNQFQSVGMNLAIVADSVFGVAIGKTEDALPQYVIPATNWSIGGYAWYSGRLNLAAFHGWEKNTASRPDHGLYWFMNYLGIDALETNHNPVIEYPLLTSYLKEIFTAEKSDKQISDTGFHDALRRISEVPAAARSAKLAGYWEKYQAEDDPRFRDALARMAEHFVEADSLLTDMGSCLAQKNLDLWPGFRPGVCLDCPFPKGFPDSTGFHFPDLSPFRFVRPAGEQPETRDFMVYPNPAQDCIYIQPRTGYLFNRTLKGSLVSADGKFTQDFLIESWESQKLDISIISAGIYFIELYSGNQYLGAAKFIKISH